MDMFSYLLGRKSGGGGTADWNAPEGTAGHVLNRTHYEEVTTVGGDTLTWDGNTEGRVCAGISCKISDAIPTWTDLENGVFLCLYPEGWYEYHTFVEVFEGVISDENHLFVIVTEKAAGVDLGSITFPESGIYFTADSGAGAYVSALTIPGYTGFKTTTTTVKTIDPKYLPEALQFGEDKAFEPIVWDGNTEGLETTTIGNRPFVKICDYFPLEKSTDVESVYARMVFGGEAQEMTQPMGASLEEHGWYVGDFAIASDGEIVDSNGNGDTIPIGVYLADLKAMSGADEVALTIYPATTVKPMDEKYMPILTSPSGKKFKITVDDSGTLSAAEVTE